MRALAALACAAVLAGCATLDVFVPGSLSGSAAATPGARAQMTDRIALGYALVAAYADEIRAGVELGTLPRAQAHPQLDRLRQAQAMLDLAAGLYLGGDPDAARQRLDAFDAVLRELRVWLATQGGRR